MDANARNFASNATVDDGSCIDPCVYNAFGEELAACLPDLAICNRTGGGNVTCTCVDGYVGDGVTICEPAAPGCMDEAAFNFDPDANIPANATDGGCVPIMPGCTDPRAHNYDPNANANDNSCVVNPCRDGSYGGCSMFANCIIRGATSYRCECRDGFIPSIDDSDEACAEVVRGCMDATAVNFEHAANVDDGSCIAAVPGCTDFTAFNFDFHSNLDDGSCIPRVLGCMQPLATNYRSEANVGTRCSPLVELEEAENITEPGDPYAHSELTWVKLDSQPRSPVNITMVVRYLNFSEAGDVLIELDNQLSIEPAAFTFVGEDDWNTSVPVLIAPVNDYVDEDQYVYRLEVFGESDDPHFVGLLDDSVTFVLHDDDTADVLMTPTSHNIRAITETARYTRT
jgi:hypothetical protein